MYTEDTNKLLEELDQYINQLKFDNRRLMHNPLIRNRKVCFDDCLHISKTIFRYQNYLNEMSYKYQRRNTNDY